MRAGRLRQLVDIQQPSSSTDSTGQEVFSYATTDSRVFAEVRNVSQRKTEDGLIQASGQEEWEVWIRYRSDITYNTRLLYNGLTLNVTSIEDHRELRHALRLRCEVADL